MNRSKQLWFHISQLQDLSIEKLENDTHNARVDLLIYVAEALYQR